MIVDWQTKPANYGNISFIPDVFDRPTLGQLIDDDEVKKAADVVAIKKAKETRLIVFALLTPQQWGQAKQVLLTKLQNLSMNPPTPHLVPLRHRFLYIYIFTSNTILNYGGFFSFFFLWCYARTFSLG